MKRFMTFTQYAALMLVLANFFACGSMQQGGLKSRGIGSGDATKDQLAGTVEGDAHAMSDQLITPPKEYFDEVMAEKLRSLDQAQLSLAAKSATLWLNFNGAALVKGFKKSESFLLCTPSASIPASGLTPSEQEEITAQVRDYYLKAGAPVLISAQQPVSGDYTTVHVGGSYKSLGCIGGDSTLGIAPLDIGNVNANDVGFAFVLDGVSTDMIALTIAHEAGHTFGLEHVDNDQDIMSPTAQADAQGFLASRVTGSFRIQDGPKLLVENITGEKLTTQPGQATPGDIMLPPIATNPTTPNASPAPSPTVNPNSPLAAILSAIPGAPQIANIAQLVSQIKNFDLSSLSSIITGVEKLVPPGVKLPGLDKLIAIVAIVEKAATSGKIALPAGTPASGMSAVSNLLSSPVLKTVAELASLAGFDGVGIAIKTATTFFDKIFNRAPTPSATPAANAAPINLQLNALPEFGKLLGLDQVKNVVDLLKLLPNHVKMVQSQYKGDDLDVLLTLIKLGYAQAYDDLQKNQP